MRRCAKLVSGVGTIPHQLSVCSCGNSFSVRATTTSIAAFSTSTHCLNQSISSPKFVQYSASLPEARGLPFSTSVWRKYLTFQNHRRNYSSNSENNDNGPGDKIKKKNDSKESLSHSPFQNCNKPPWPMTSAAHEEALLTNAQNKYHMNTLGLPTTSTSTSDRCSMNLQTSKRNSSANSGTWINAGSGPSHAASASGIATMSTSATFTPARTVVTSQKLIDLSRDSTMEQPKLMCKEEREEFMSVYHDLVKELMEIPDMKDMEETNRWMARVLQYNVPHGKRNRGLYTALAYKYLAPEELTEENVRLSYILGWCVEILQAFFLVSDDIMDESETRRGRPCWYKVDNLGLAAVNDALLLEATIYQILRKHFSDKLYFAKVMEVMHDVTYKTIFGQSLDTRTGQDRKMETYTMDRYSSIVKYKTSYYTFYLPVALAMTLCDMNNPALLQQVRKVTLEMGHFFQIQDDYLDCYGDVDVTGKIGTDIQDCKCSWLFVTAMQRCNAEQKKLLLENYGKHDQEKVDIVKKLYSELALEDAYHAYEEQTYNLICNHIQQMSEELPKGLFYDMLHKIYKRSS